MSTQINVTDHAKMEWLSRYGVEEGIEDRIRDCYSSGIHCTVEGKHGDMVLCPKRGVLIVVRTGDVTTVLKAQNQDINYDDPVHCSDCGLLQESSGPCHNCSCLIHEYEGSLFKSDW